MRVEIFLYVDHAMVCRRRGFIIQRHNELRNLGAEILKVMYNDIQTEPVLQEINGEVLTPGTNRAADLLVDIHASGFWERQGSAFFDVPRIHSLMEASPQIRSTDSVRMRRRECTPADC